MSVHIGLQSFRNKEISKFPRSIVWNVFGPKAHLCNEGWALLYDGGSSAVLYLDDDELIDRCSVNRPCSASLADLYTVSQQVPSAISNNGSFIVADEAFIAEMPDWLLNALPKPPKVAHSAEELIHYLSYEW